MYNITSNRRHTFLFPQGNTGLHCESSTFITAQAWIVTQVFSDHKIIQSLFERATGKEES